MRQILLFFVGIFKAIWEMAQVVVILALLWTIGQCIMDGFEKHLPMLIIVGAIEVIMFALERGVNEVKRDKKIRKNLLYPYHIER